MPTKIDYFRVQDLEFQDLGFQDSGCRALGLGLRKP